MSEKSSSGGQTTNEGDRPLLIINENPPFGDRLVVGMKARGFVVTAVASAKQGVRKARKIRPEFVILGLKLADGNGLEVIPVLRKLQPKARIVVLTSYGSIVAAVAAIQMGADNFMTTPVDACRIDSALLGSEKDLPQPSENLMSPNCVRWEYIKMVLEMCEGNISETAKKLGMHRRTLQRIMKTNMAT